MIWLPQSRFCLIFALGFVIGNNANAQQTTNTNCNTYGSSTNCTSTTTDNSANNQRAYQAGQQVGNALGQGLAGAMQAHSFNKGLKRYCDGHPGQKWTYHSGVDGHVLSSGYCPSAEDKRVEAANAFIAHHKEYVPCDTNSQVILAYLDDHRLDPREEKSYERAYKDLKKSGKLALYVH